MIAISIGHSRKIKGRYDGGAYSESLGKNEREFNIEVATILSQILHAEGVKSLTISDYRGTGYTSAMRDAARQIKGIGATLAIELHFNSATPTAHGHEWLYWHNSEKGEKLARTFHDQFQKDFTGIKARGLKPLDDNSRGAQFVKLTHCPAVLLEPFFGSNERDCLMVSPQAIAESYARSIIKYLC